MQYLRLIYHFISSHSRHGTHSPFMYRLADEVIYAKSKMKCSHGQQDCLLGDIASYLGVTYVDSASESGMDKAIIVDGTLVNIDYLAQLTQAFKFIVIPDIYKNKLCRSLWKSICADSRFIVSVDLFYYGLVFFRKEQPKENFKLRFPYWR